MDSEMPGSTKVDALVFWVMRAVYLLSVGLIFLIVAMFALGSLIEARANLQHPQVPSEAPHFISVLTLVLVGGGLMIVIPCYVAVFVRWLRSGRAQARVPRALRQLTAGDTDWFAFVFAAFAAFDFSYCLPRHLSYSWHVPVPLLFFFVLKYVVERVVRRSLRRISTAA